MTKITGNEFINHATALNGGISGGIPIRLYIAVMIATSPAMANEQFRGGFPDLSAGSVECADTLIATYNDTPNPNE